MISVNVHEAKTHLSRLLTQIVAGEDVVIMRYGKPLARLVPAQPVGQKRQSGLDHGLFRVPEDFNEEDPEVTRRFES